MYGLIFKDKESEWWVRRKAKGKSDIVISREQVGHVVEYELSYVISNYCDCPIEVKNTARELISRLEKDKEDVISAN